MSTSPCGMPVKARSLRLDSEIFLTIPNRNAFFYPDFGLVAR